MVDECSSFIPGTLVIPETCWRSLNNGHGFLSWHGEECCFYAVGAIQYPIIIFFLQFHFSYLIIATIFIHKAREVLHVLPVDPHLSQPPAVVGMTHPLRLGSGLCQ
jgi:hypothetical protein